MSCYHKAKRGLADSDRNTYPGTSLLEPINRCGYSLWILLWAGMDFRLNKENTNMSASF